MTTVTTTDGAGDLVQGQGRRPRRDLVVVGGTGLIGSKLVKNLRAEGHDAVAASPDTGVNTLTGEGLGEALAGADVVVDVSNSPSFEDAAVLEFFDTSTRNLLDTEAAAGVRHHVALSVVGTDRLPDSGYMRAKLAQEKLIKGSAVPCSIVHATQFFEFATRIVKTQRRRHSPRAPGADSADGSRRCRRRVCTVVLSARSAARSRSVAPSRCGSRTSSASGCALLTISEPWSPTLRLDTSAPVCREHSLVPGSGAAFRTDPIRRVARRADAQELTMSHCLPAVVHRLRRRAMNIVVIGGAGRIGFQARHQAPRWPSLTFTPKPVMAPGVVTVRTCCPRRWRPHRQLRRRSCVSVFSWHVRPRRGR